jgi:hypothetical protein
MENDGKKIVPQNGKHDKKKRNFWRKSQNGQRKKRKIRIKKTIKESRHIVHSA